MWCGLSLGFLRVPARKPEAEEGEKGTPSAGEDQTLAVPGKREQFLGLI